MPSPEIARRRMMYSEFELKSRYLEDIQRTIREFEQMAADLERQVSTRGRPNGRARPLASLILDTRRSRSTAARQSSAVGPSAAPETRCRGYRLRSGFSARGAAARRGGHLTRPRSTGGECGAYHFLQPLAGPRIRSVVDNRDSEFLAQHLDRLPKIVAPLCCGFGECRVWEIRAVAHARSVFLDSNLAARDELPCVRIREWYAECPPNTSILARTRYTSCDAQGLSGDGMAQTANLVKPSSTFVIRRHTKSFRSAPPISGDKPLQRAHKVRPTPAPCRWRISRQSTETKRLNKKSPYGGLNAQCGHFKSHFSLSRKRLCRLAIPNSEPEMWMGGRREVRYAGHKDLLSAKEPGVTIEHVSGGVSLSKKKKKPKDKAKCAVDDDDEGRIRRHDWVPVKEEQGVSARSPIRQHHMGTR